MRIQRGDAANRAIEILERMLRDDRCDFAADTAGQPILVHDQHFAGLLRG